MASELTIPQVVRRHVDSDSARVFFTFRDLKAASSADQVLTYGDLWSGASAFAESFKDLPKGGCALLVMPLGPRLLQAHLGVQLAGGVPIIHSHPSGKIERQVYLRQLTHVLELTRPELVITAGEFAGAIRDANPRETLTVEDVPARSAFEAAAWKDAGADDVAILQHSSGSTGIQKGVALTHGMIRRQCASYAAALEVDPSRDVVCSWLPLYHDMGLFTTWLLPLVERVPVAALDPFAWVSSPASFLRLISDKRATLCWQPNFAYNLLAARVQDSDLEGISLASMRAFNNCSEPVLARSHKLFLDRYLPHGLRPEALRVCYAMAENAFAVTSSAGPAPILSCDPAALSKNRAVAPTGGTSTEVVSCGTPIEGCEVKVVDDQRRSLAPREVGEVALRSDCLMKEYFRNEEATARAMDAEGWYHTGDLGFLADGELFITGRKKDLLIIAGRNFYPQDIEQVCDGLPGAVPGRSVAIGASDEASGTERIVVLVESRQSGDAAASRLLERSVRQKVLEELDCPVSEVHIVPHMWLVKTTSGKIARAPNLQRYRNEFKSSSTPAVPEAVPTLAEVAVPSFAAALALYLYFALQANASFGVYAGF